MKNRNQFEVIVIGGSYAGLSAAMALGRSLRKTLIIDSGKPCNRQTPYSHNFITLDGTPPAVIAEKAKEQVLQYDTVIYEKGLVTQVEKEGTGFTVKLDNGEFRTAQKVLFSTGVRDIMPPIPGFKECWGITVIHCPYCHGYEVRNARTGILAHGEKAFDFSKMIRHWTDDLTLFTNGEAGLTQEQRELLKKLHVEVVEKKISGLTHDTGMLKHIDFADGTDFVLDALYHHADYEQHCKAPEQLGCQLTEQGHIEVDFFGKTTIEGVFAAGDNTTPMRAVSVAVAAGTKAGAFINKELIDEAYK
ncbi:NAD(P)/FAD-dependent oxidoreductase [Sinomicrobium pectinilyticum]|uniref:NAD(P)/FAD-dependent oxidoreductase n=1 Tax=Sinomicrobium pectinilyticum TaxID=1084421 RepID=A0A3N0EGT4_SINP1|nr:NAD(P)/FAD-dependent oxidoreductase [Sinomicrobium pectinilyticum]RNL87093.1 NAD(P)/FAD-dependent oxidoreductase [Sinomicrobium pectinilyticum]